MRRKKRKNRKNTGKLLKIKGKQTKKGMKHKTKASKICEKLAEMLGGLKGYLTQCKYHNTT